MDFIYNYLRLSAGSIFFWFPILGIIYGAAYLVRKYHQRAPHPSAITGLVAVLLVFVLPSLPRYMFGDITRNQLSKNEPWFHFIDSGSYGSLIEPITWIFAPEDNLLFVAPNVDYSWGGWRYDKDNHSNAFISMRVTYSSGATFEFIDMDCASRLVEYSFADETGVLRRLPKREAEASEVVMFCERDYSDSAEMIYRHREKNTNLEQPE